MMLFDQVLQALDTRRPFTVYPFHVGPYKPEGRVVHEFKEVEVGQIGYILQWWAKLAIYKPKTISFNWAGDALQIIYHANANAEASSNDGSDTLGIISESETVTG